MVLLLVLGMISIPVYAQRDIELVKLADYFSKYYQYADEARMTEALTDDFRYLTNVPCPYKDCPTGATKKTTLSVLLTGSTEIGK